MVTMKKQTLHGSNRSMNINEALSARVKDALWFMSRQWQTGEFEAENGGSLADIEMHSQHFPVAKLRRGKKETDIDPNAPLEALVEAENDVTDDAPAWKSEALEYRFELDTTGHVMEASDYSGFQLDWFQFDLVKDRNGDGAVVDAPQNFIPTQLSFKGAPNPRWWEMEDGEAYFDTPAEIEPSILSTLLPEFFYTDINNWYLIPAPMPAGSVREITALKVTDSFGVTSEISAVDEKDWKVFALEDAQGKGAGLSGSSLFAPNIALDILHNDVIEDVRFIRDEQANLVWAWEHCYTTNTGEKIINGDQPVNADPSGDEKSASGYRFMSDVPANWIPYIAVQINLTPSDGEVYLRRGRTDPKASKAEPQHKSQIVAESTRLFEEEIPRTGLRVRRLKKFARGSDENDYFWVGRHKDAGRGFNQAGLFFDFVDGDDDQENPPPPTA